MSSVPRTRRQLEQDLRMLLSRRLHRSLAPPDWLSINLTLRCNLRCRMCTTCYPVEKELETGEILGLIDQAAAWGVQILNPLGGEPFMRPDLETILAHAALRDFHITLTTNATLITPARATALAAIPPEKLHINISLDGPQALHDDIRGAGNFQRALAGYRALRQADAAAGHPLRKVLANTLLHDHLLEALPAFLEQLVTLGFDGVQLLTLFREPGQAATTPPAGPAADLWVPPARLQTLEDLCTWLRAYRHAPPSPPFNLLNSDEDLALLPAYYAGRLNPLSAPCWAGWKELYVNTDGRTIMCDGKLDFLAGAFGDVRRQTLRQIWQSPALRARREVVRHCTTPCAQSCYLRRESDSLRLLLGQALQAGGDTARRHLAQRLPRRPRPICRLEQGVLTLELADVCDCAWPGCSTPDARLTALLARAPAPLSTCQQDPSRWLQWRDRHYVDFGRGFMGFELVRRVVEDLRAAGMGFGTLALRWRGEPLLHPEIHPLLPYLLAATGPGQIFGRIQVHTSGLLLLPDTVHTLLEHPNAPVDWLWDLDRAGPAASWAWEHLQPLLAGRGSALRLVLCRSVIPGSPLSVAADLARFHGLGRLQQAAGLPPEGPGDGYWLRRTDPRTFLGDQAANTALAQAAAQNRIALRLLPTTGQRPCPGALDGPVVSWDGKVTLCPWDTALANRVGEVTHQSLPEIWSSPALQRAQQAVRAHGRPPFEMCRDCHQVESPNYRQATRDALHHRQPRVGRIAGRWFHKRT